jgi:hypothetical protein
VAISCAAMLWFSAAQSVLRGSQGNHDQLPGDTWIRFCNGYYEFYIFFVFGNNNRGTFLIGGVFISCDLLSV